MKRKDEENLVWDTQKDKENSGIISYSRLNKNNCKVPYTLKTKIKSYDYFHYRERIVFWRDMFVLSLIVHSTLMYHKIIFIYKWTILFRENTDNRPQQTNFVRYRLVA